jgi:hypothetical protein
MHGDSGRSPHDYGDSVVNKAALEKLLAQADLSELDTEILYLRIGYGWQLDDIAEYVGQKYYGRTAENPLWERAIRYRLEKSLKTLRRIAQGTDLMLENPSIVGENG